MRKSFGFMVLAGALAGCVPAETPPAAIGGTCGAVNWQHLLGQPRTAIGQITHEGPMRVIEPGMAVTMDYASGRMNVLLTENGRIEAITCG
ncbi:hypothetical protein GCM10007291_28010 [Gemmobacter nanjingensis]|uniref:Peptidase inhibitor I78 family protein n=1 Tax=Gemmobacter nanjingensis TaxID=488454 RepID=A0ABQ3FJ26_9RHOB|nr:I78 family peptidase inhibitor [Gemmobacter nanjingensis]GHC26506.1 hypothetical protein GCM10007291_28010 [Gemmobacter nanjingensis]